MIVSLLTSNHDRTLINLYLGLNLKDLRSSTTDELIPQLPLGLNFCTLSGTNMTEFTLAYTEYLERMFDESHELVNVDVFSVPQDVDPTSPAVQEWAHFE